jgi:filamentous hemagglutinin family protein
MKKRTSVFTPNALALAVAGCFCLGPVYANPVGPQVASGGASFATQGNTLAITNTPGAIINWQGFSIGAGETTRFNQASAASAVLNRVVTSTPSQLFGQLQSNGRVFLINPAGILIGAGAVIDTAGLVASTLNLSNADFLAGRLNFKATPGAGKVENFGSISTPSGGSVYLVGAQVENHGIINAPNGEVLLAAGKTAQLIDTGTPGVRVEITADAEQSLNVGQILAESGRVGMVGAIVRNSGRISASSAANNVTSVGGRIFLKATQDTYVDKTGAIEATGTTGGAVEVLGQRVALLDAARIDASGTQGGGTILVGGDFQGKNAEIQNASISYVGGGVSLKADASESGNGGKVIVWSDDTTRFYGDISAKGGSRSGNGGFVEVSGKRYLDFQGMVNTAAAQGLTGTLLLDPEGIRISTAASSGGMSPTTPFSGPMSGLSILNVSTLQTALTSTDVVVDGSGAGSNANGSVTVDAAVSWANSNQLTLKSGNSGGIIIDKAITAAAGALKLDAGTAGINQSLAGVIETASLGILSKGDVNLNIAPNQVATIAANVTGNLAFTNSAAIITGTAGGIPGITASGDVTLTASGNITQTAAIIAAGLNVSSTSNVNLFNSANRVNTFAATMSGSGFLSFTNAQALTLNETHVTTGNTADIKTTTGDLTVAGPIVSTAQFRLDAAGSIDVNSSIDSAAKGTQLVAHAGWIKSNASGILTGPLEAQMLGDGYISLLADNHVSALSAKVVNGSLSFNNADSFIVGEGSNISGITANAALTLSTNNLLTVNAPLNAANITLSADRMALLSDIRATQNGTVWLKQLTAGRAIDLGSPTDAANALELSAAELALVSANGNGRIKIGDLTDGHRAGNINISAPIAISTDASNNLVLESGGGITQSGTGAITVKNLLINSNGNVIIDSTPNNVAKIAANLSGTAGQNFRFNNAAGFAVGKVDGIEGITANGATTALKALNGNIAIDEAITDSSGTLWLATLQGGITQTASISAAGLEVVSAGDVTLNYYNSEMNRSNQVGKLAASVTGISAESHLGSNFKFTNSTRDLTIGSVGSTTGVGAAGDITLLQNGAGSIAVNDIVASTTGDVLISVASGTGGATVAAGKSISGKIVGLATVGGDITINGSVTGTTSAEIYAAAGAIRTAAPGFVSAPNIFLQQKTPSTGAIGTDALSPFTTISPGGGNANIHIGSSGYGPSAVYLSHSGDATLTKVYTKIDAPINIAATHDITVGTAIFTGGDLTLSAGNKLTQASDDTPLSAANITLVADKMALAGNVVALGNGTVWLKPHSSGRSIVIGADPGNDDTALYLADTSNAKLTSPNLTIGSAAAGDIAVNSAIDRSGGRLSLISGGATGQSASIAAAELAVIAGGAVLLNSPDNAVGKLAIRNSGNTAFSNNGILTIASLTAGTVNPTTINGIEGGIGNITISSPLGIVLAAPVLAFNPGYTVTLSALSGSISASHSGTSVIASGFNAFALTGIGSMESPLKTRVSYLKAVNSMGGDVAFDNTGGLTTDVVSTGAGKISIATHSPLTIGAGGVSAGGDISLSAGASAGGTGDILTINGAVTSANGSIVLAAGNEITGNGAISATNGSVTRTANSNPSTPVTPPTINQCVANPALAGCSAVLPTIASCTANPSAPGCSTVLPVTPVTPVTQVTQVTQATLAQTVTELDNAQANTQPETQFVDAPVAVPPPVGGATPIGAVQTLAGGVIGGETPNTFGSEPPTAAPAGSPHESPSAGDGEPKTKEDKDGKTPRKPGQCMA